MEMTMQKLQHKLNGVVQLSISLPWEFISIWCARCRYIEVDESNGVNLFYYFVQSEQDPSKDPVLLWLQGGPGCSGLSGLVYEIGPFLFDVQGYKDELPRLLYRPETWTKVSNIIFVDSPVGAGFSYASSKEGHMSSDTIAIKQLVIFLNKVTTSVSSY
ncbi:hypothetical protein EJB05_00834, partial [Eragrostis curvula]